MERRWIQTERATENHYNRSCNIQKGIKHVLLAKTDRIVFTDNVREGEN